MNILCLVAHPDDETILCGGALALLASRGARVHIACLTRGEGGELGEPPATDRRNLGDVREQEMVCAVQKLGGRSLTFLGYVDPVVGPDDQLFAPEHNPTLLAGQIVNSIKHTGAEAVLTHGSNGEYGHPAHLLMHQMTLAAVLALHKEEGASALHARLMLYTFAAAFPEHPYPRLTNPDDPADIVLDVSSVLERKEAAALCHLTQNALFVRRRSEQAGRPLTVRETIIPVEGLRRVFGEPDDAFTRMLNERNS